MRRKLPSSAALAFVLAPFLAPGAFSQTLNTNAYVTNGRVLTSVHSNGVTYLGGNFTEIGPVTGATTLVDRATGVPLPGSRVAGEVWAVASDGAGGWYVGGVFQSAQGATRNNMAHFDASGNVTAWNPNANGLVSALCVSGNVVYAGGSFTTVGGQTRNRIAAINATTGAVMAWNPNANNTVNAIAVSSGAVYAGGTFTTIGGQARNRIAAIDSASATVTPWNPDANGSVSALATKGSLLYAGGDFTMIGGVTHNRLAAIDQTTGIPTAWTPSASGLVKGLAIGSGVIYACGNFATMNGLTRIGTAAIDSASGATTTWAPHGSGAQTLAVDGSSVYVGGDFTFIGGQSRLRLAEIDAATGIPSAWNPRANELVRSIAIAGTRVAAGGDFSSVGGQNRNYLAAVDASGVATSWDPRAGNEVGKLLLQDNLLYAAGTFTSIGGVTRNRLAAIDTSGALAAWNPNASAGVEDIAITRMTVAPFTSTVYAGGGFTTIGGQTRNRLAAIDATTGAVGAWNPDANSTVFAIAASVDPATGAADTIYVGGSLSTIGGLPRTYLAAVDSAGAVLAWIPSANGTVLDLALSNDGTRVYVGGSFTMLAGTSRRYIGALDPATGAASNWDPDANSTVRCFLETPGGLLVGGSFTSIGGKTRSLLAEIDPVTGLAGTWSSSILGNYPRDYMVSSIETITRDGATLYVGGSFSRIGTSPRTCFAMYTGSLVDVPEHPSIAGQGRLTCAPNPAQGRMDLRFDLARNGRVELSIHDIAGRRVRDLHRGEAIAGSRQFTWDGLDLSGRMVSPGIYFARLVADRRTSTARLVRVE